MKKHMIIIYVVISIIVLSGCNNKNKLNNKDIINDDLINKILINDSCFEEIQGEYIEASTSNIVEIRKEKVMEYIKFDSNLIFFRYLKENMRGIDVKGVNKALNLLGYGTDSESILFDNKTKNAVMSFQKSNNLSTDGIVGLQTINMLNKALENWEIFLPNFDIVPKNIPSNGYWITIDKTTNVLTLYNNREVVKRYSVATGRTPSLTPDGKFSIVNKVIDPSWGGNGKAEPIPGGDPNNPLGTRWMGISWGNGTKYGIHGNSNPSSIGHFVSSGCIRMYNLNVEELFNTVNKKTPVWIGSFDKLYNWMVN